MNESRFEVAELAGVIAALSEIGILVDGAGDETRDFGNALFVGAEDEREGGCEGGGGLRGWKGEFGDVVAMLRSVSCVPLREGRNCRVKLPVIESKGPLNLVDCGSLS